MPVRAEVREALEGLTPAMRRALLVEGRSTFVAWQRGEVQTQTMNRLDRARLWVKVPGGWYQETRLGSDVTRALKEEGHAEARSFPIFGLDEDTDELVCPSCGHRVDLLDPSMGADHWFAEHPDEEVE